MFFFYLFSRLVQSSLYSQDIYISPVYVTFGPARKALFFFNLHYTVDVFINENKCRLNMLMVLLKNDVT